MAEQPLLDPFWFWRNLVEQMGKSVNQNAKENMQSEEFARALAHVTDASVAGRNMTRALMKKYFEAFDLPSRSDMLALDERLGDRRPTDQFDGDAQSTEPGCARACRATHGHCAGADPEASCRGWVTASLGRPDSAAIE